MSAYRYRDSPLGDNARNRLEKWEANPSAFIISSFMILSLIYSIILRQVRRCTILLKARSIVPLASDNGKWIYVVLSNLVGKRRETVLIRSTQDKTRHGDEDQKWCGLLWEWAGLVEKGSTILADLLLLMLCFWQFKGHSLEGFCCGVNLHLVFFSAALAPTSLILTIFSKYERSQNFARSFWLMCTLSRPINGTCQLSGESPNLLE